MAPLFHMEALLRSSISPKIASILQSHVYPRVGRVFHALARLKSYLLAALGSKRRGAPWPRSGKHAAIGYRSRSPKRSKNVASVKTPHHFVLPSGGGSSGRAKELNVDYTAWNVVEGGGGEDVVEYCGYLCWLEEEETPAVAEEGEDVYGGGGGMNEIDRLAEKFIARCHAKFLLEKQESYRRYQEMMARSI